MDNFIFLPDRSKKNAGNSATGKLSAALGQHCTASGDFSFADGSGCIASTTCSVALGNAADASGTCGFMYRDICDNTFCFDSGGQNGDNAHIKINGNLAAGGGHLPVGAIMSFAGTSTSLGPSWMLCDGSPISRTDYSNLWAAISDHYGGGDGSTTFNIPDLRGRTIFGSVATLGATAVAGDPTRAGVGILGSLNGHRKITNNTMPAHTHEVSLTYTPGSYQPAQYSGPEGGHYHSFNFHSLDQIQVVMPGGDNANLGPATWINICDPNNTKQFQTGNNVEPPSGTWPNVSFTPGSFTAGHFGGSGTAESTGGGEDYLPPALVMNFYIRCK